jgi:hypothetical protein
MKYNLWQNKLFSILVSCLSNSCTCQLNGANENHLLYCTNEAGFATARAFRKLHWRQTLGTGLKTRKTPETQPQWINSSQLTNWNNFSTLGDRSKTSTASLRNRIRKSHCDVSSGPWRRFCHYRPTEKRELLTSGCKYRERMYMFPSANRGTGIVWWCQFRFAMPLAAETGSPS